VRACEIRLTAEQLYPILLALSAHGFTQRVFGLQPGG
jgi:hypothetical protein